MINRIAELITYPSHKILYHFDLSQLLTCLLTVLLTPCTLLTPVSAFPLHSLTPLRSSRSCRLWWSMCPVRAPLCPMSHTLFTLRLIKYSLVPGPGLAILLRTLALMLLSLLLPSQLFTTVDAAFPPIFLTSLLLFFIVFIYTLFLPFLFSFFIPNFSLFSLFLLKL